MRRESKSGRHHAWRLQPDRRLRLHRPHIDLQDQQLCQEAADLEVQFFEGILERDPCHEEVLRLLGYIYTARTQYREGLEMDLRLIRLRPQDATAFYNLACSYALLGEADKAFEALGRAMTLGYDHAEEMDTDPDLESIRSDPRYAPLRMRTQHPG